MPHKHKRRGNDDSIYDLPPSVIAKPLPVRDPGKNQHKGSRAKNQQKPSSSLHAIKNNPQDDTPKAFKRLLQYQQRQSKSASTGLDDREHRKKKGNSNSNNNNNNNNNTKKRKRGNDDTGPVATTKQTKKESNQTSTETKAIPKIMPGEKFSDFAARVDRALPLSGIQKSARPAPSDLPKLREERRTKHEKRLLRLQKQWREEEERIREREAAEREEREAEMEEELELWKKWEAERRGSKARKKNKNKKNKDGAGAVDDDADPWAKLKNRDPVVKANPFDVVQAPPQLTKPREVFKVRGGAGVDVANVPAAAGSLRRREELAGERRNIVEEYRRLMSEKRKQ